MPVRPLLLLILPSRLAAGPADLPTGVVIPRVACRAEPSLSYALYLPKGYREGGAWPVLFGFSPGGLGREPVDLFREAADRSGCIVVGSNDSRNGPLGPALQAMRALWKDVNARFKVDPRRCYAVGFSGGARMALRLVQDHPRAFSGLISFGAFGFGPGELAGLKGTRFVLACGLEDFNHWELLDGRAQLRSRGLPAWAERYEGGHGWPPPETCEEALAFLEGGTAVQGGGPSAFPARRRRAAEEAEAQGLKLLALRRWEDLAEAFPQSPEGRGAAERLPLLAKDPDVRAELDLEERYRRIRAGMDPMRSTPRYVPELERLHRLSREGKDPEALMARRVLSGECLVIQMAAFEALEARDWPRAALLFRTLASLRERDPMSLLYLAGALAQLEQKGEALRMLRLAYDRGFRGAEDLRKSERLKGLRGDPEFERLLSSMDAPP